MIESRPGDPTAPQVSSDGDRRSTPRYEAGETIVVLSWAEGDSYRSVEGPLRDVSQGGGAVVAKSAPAVGTVVWFRIQGDQTSPWVEGRVVSVRRKGRFGFGRDQVIHWRFKELCPYPIFRSAIPGFTRSVDVHDEQLPGFEKRDWRG